MLALRANHALYRRDFAGAALAAGAFAAADCAGRAAELAAARFGASTNLSTTK